MESLGILLLCIVFLIYCFAEGSADVAISKIQHIAMKSASLKRDDIIKLEKQWKDFQFCMHTITVSFFSGCIFNESGTTPQWHDFLLLWVILMLFHSTFHDRFIMWKLSGNFWLLEKRPEFSAFWWDNLWWILFPKQPNKSAFLGKISTFSRLILITILIIILIYA